MGRPVVSVALSWAEAHSCGADLGRVADVVRARVTKAVSDAVLTVSVSAHARRDDVTYDDPTVRRTVETIVRAAWCAVLWSGGCSV